jgi:hypothetical protein
MKISHKLEKTCRKKHSSLLRRSVSTGENRFVTFAPDEADGGRTETPEPEHWPGVSLIDLFLSFC